MIVSDNGTELTSNAILAWADQTRVDWHYIAPGKPMQNAFIESFNGRLRDEFLNETLFTSLAQARAALEVAGGLQHRASSFAHRLADAGGRYRTSSHAQRGQGAALTTAPRRGPLPPTTPRSSTAGSSPRWIKVGGNVSCSPKPSRVPQQRPTYALCHAA